MNKELIENLRTFLAKSEDTEGKNRLLLDHTQMVINTGMRIGELIYQPKDEDDKCHFMQCLGLALMLHDIGKMNKDFQEYLRKGKKIDEEGLECYNKDDKPRHNVISWAYAVSKIKGLNCERFVSVTAPILWHHTCGKLDGNTQSDSILKSISNTDIEWMDAFYNYFKQYMSDNYGISYDGDDEDFSLIQEDDKWNRCDMSSNYVYAKLETFDIESTNREKAFSADSKIQIIRGILIFADRLVSSGGCDLCKILSNDTDYIDNYFASISEAKFKDDVNVFDFDYNKERLSKQVTILDKTLGHNHNAIKASAGFGKTLMGLMWFFREKKRLLWVVPRNVIAEGTYHSILKELENMRLNGKVNVGLYYSNEIKAKNCDATNLDNFDILVTNIDSILKRTTVNSEANLLVNLYTSNIVFDEYHEFKSAEPLFSSLIRLMRIRSRHTKSKTIMLSASKNNYDTLWGSNVVNYIDNADVLYGDTMVKVVFHEVEDTTEIEPQDNDSFTILPTIPEAQNTYEKNNKMGVLVHASYTEKDRKEITDKIFKYHGPNSIKKLKERMPVIGTNIIGTGLDISCKYIHDFIISAESTIQRTGRASRFGEYGEIEYNIYIFKNNNGKKRIKLPFTVEIIGEKGDKQISAINASARQLYEKWIDILKEYDGNTITKSDIYELYDKFQQENRLLIDKYYISLFNQSSIALLGIDVKPSRKQSKNGVRYLGNGMTYRGNNDTVFVTAKESGTKEWSDPITYDRAYLDGNGEDENVKEALNAMGAITKFKYPDKNELKFKYGITNKGNIQNNEGLYKMGKCEHTPRPIFNYTYDSEFGLRRIKINK